MPVNGNFFKKETVDCIAGSKKCREALRENKSKMIF